MRTFADACRAVLDAPGADHSLSTTLAPLYESMLADEGDRFDRQFRLARSRLPRSVETVLEVGCGVGGLLPLLAGAYGDVVGLDRSTALLAYAARRTDEGVTLVAGDAAAADLDLDRRFDAVVSFGYLASTLDSDGRLRALLRTARRHLRPGGVLVLDAVSGPAAVREESIRIYRDGRYVLERAVDVSPGGRADYAVVADHRVTDRETGESATATERTPVRTFQPDAFRERVAGVGFESVRVDAVAGERDALVASAVRPVETG